MSWLNTLIIRVRGSWTCGNCGALNWESRTCKQCGS